MKFRLIALAAMATVAGSASALTPTQIDAARTAGTLKEVTMFGASAQSPLVGAYMGSICNNDLDTFFNSGGSGTGKDHRAYSCTLHNTIPGTGGWVAGTPVLVTKRDAGGAIWGVNPVALQSAELAMVVNDVAGNCVSTGLVASATVASYNCATTALTVPVAGISDVEPAIFSKVATVGATPGVGFNLPVGNDDNGVAWRVLTTPEIVAMDSAVSNQTLFGIAVNIGLRNAMQAAQGLTVGSDADADVPSMPKAFYSAAVSGFVKGNTAGVAGWDALTGVAADNALQVNICRRVQGSGTQASSNLYFLEAGTIGLTSTGMLYPLPSNGVAVAVSGAPLAIVEGSGTGNVEDCIRNAPAGSYAMGVITGEKDPISGGKAYRFVRIDGSLKTQANGRIGGYGFNYSATMQWKKSGVGIPNVGTKAFLVNMRKNLATPAKIATLTDAAARAGVLAPPSGYTGSCASQTAGSANALYGSCVERLDFASAYNDGILFYGLTATTAYKTNSSQALHTVK